MEYGKIISRSASIVWEKKFLIVLGVLAALGGISSSNFNFSSDSSGNGQSFEEFGQFPELDPEITGLAVGLVLGLICVGLVVGIALWVISTTARGGLIAGVDAIESGKKETSFGQAWRAGWQRIWTLLGIGIIPAIPVLILVAIGMLSVAASGGLFALFNDEFAEVGMAGIGATVAVIACCILIPIALALEIIRNFAERACMLEDLGTIDSYRRGFTILKANLGEAIILVVVQIGIFILLGIFLLLPTLFAALCCCLWPLLILLNGALSAFVSALWTLAWRTWTGEPPLVEKEPVAV